MSPTLKGSIIRKAILNNKADFEGKIVLDVGAGTGILSVYCAQAGAKKVYAIEATQVYKIAEEIARENSYDNVIEVVHSKVEDFKLPDGLKVDIIVSEWMGFYLLHEGMLDSVLYARDHFLKPDGLLFPESATIYTTPCSVPQLYDNWADVNGVSMNSFAVKLREQCLKKPETIQISSEDVLAQPEVVAWLDLRDITAENLNELKSQIFVVASKASKFQGVAVWFTCSFPSKKTEPVILSTDPEDAATHWKQTVIVLPTECSVEEKEPIAYEICLRRKEDAGRRYDIELTMVDPERIDHPEYCFCYMTKCILQRAVIDKYENEVNMEEGS